jgi:hypothetical protein
VGPASVAVALFIGHRLLMSALDVSLWTEVGIAALEMLAAYGALWLFGRSEITGRLQSVRALLAS